MENDKSSVVLFDGICYYRLCNLNFLLNAYNQIKYLFWLYRIEKSMGTQEWEFLYLLKLDLK
jgi:hypothetical protein